MRRRTPVVEAQVFHTYNVPKAGGRCVAGLASGLAFEDSNGVIRVLSSDGRFVVQFTRD